MVFTSPPYEYIEKYEDMKKYNDFYEDYFFPTIRNAYKYMKKGIFALNMPEKMYNRTIEVLGKSDMKIKYEKQARAGCVGKTVDKRGRKCPQNFELVYVWKKV